MTAWCFIIYPTYQVYRGVYSFCLFVHLFVSAFICSSFCHVYGTRVKVFASKFRRHYIIKTLWWISFIFGMVVDIGQKFFSVPPHPGPDLEVKIMDLEFSYKSKNFCTFLARLYESTGRAIALPLALALASALTKMLKFYVKVFKTLYFLNPQMDLVYIWYKYRCWSKILLSSIYNPAYDL